MKRFVGHINISKKYKDGTQEEVFKSRNTISDGLPYSLVKMLTSFSEQPSNDFSIKYFQLGIGSLSGFLPSKTLDTNFYQLASPLAATDYGNTSLYGPVTLSQLVAPNGNFTSFTEFYRTEAAFIPLARGVKTDVNNSIVSVRITIDENMANGLSLTELGMFLRNPLGSPNFDEPLLMAYKTFPSISKTSDFSLIVDWKITVVDKSQTFNSEMDGLPTGNYETVTIDFVSGVNGLSNMGTSSYYNQSLQILIPSAFTPNNGSSSLPLVVIFPDFGSLDSPYTTFSSLANEANSRGWLVVAPKTTQNLYTHSPALAYNTNSFVGLEHIKSIVNNMVQWYNIDKTKIYFYGFGYGGGCAMSYASYLTDSRPTAWRPAAVICHAGVLSNRFTWWLNAANTMTSPSGDYPTPPNATMQTPAKAVTFWSVSAGNLSGVPDNIPAELTSNSTNGAGWSTISGTTPTTLPWRYLQGNVVDFNINTSAVNLWTSTCTVMNLQHLPLYLHWNTNDPSGGLVTLPNLVLSGFLTSGPYASDFNATLRASATGTHNLSSINLVEALNFCSGYSTSTIYSASTVVARDGHYWGFDLYSYATPDYDLAGYHIYTAASASQAVWGTSTLGLSGFAYLVWESKPDTNELYVSGDWLIYNDNNKNMYFTPSDLGLTMGTSAVPLVIYTLSSMDLAASAGGFGFWSQYYFPHPWVDGAGGVENERRITIRGAGNNPYMVRCAFEISPGVFNLMRDCVRSFDVYGNAVWKRLGTTIATEDGDDLLLRRKGKYEIIKYVN